MRFCRRTLSLLLLLSLIISQAAASVCAMAERGIPLAADHDAGDTAHAGHAPAADPSADTGTEGSDGAVECAALMCSAAAPGVMVDAGSSDLRVFDAAVFRARGHATTFLTFDPPPPRHS